MRKFITTFLLCFLLVPSFSQANRKLSAYVNGQYTKTIYDQTIGNNPWGLGLGLQFFLNGNSKFKPTIDLTADAYLEDDKVYRSNADGTEVIEVGGMVNAFAGASFHPTSRIYLSLVGGPSFVGGQTLVGVKPSFGFYFSAKQRWMGKVSYLNIFNRGNVEQDGFGAVSLGVGVRVF